MVEHGLRRLEVDLQTLGIAAHAPPEVTHAGISADTQAAVAAGRCKNGGLEGPP